MPWRIEAQKRAAKAVEKKTAYNQKKILTKTKNNKLKDQNQKEIVCPNNKNLTQIIVAPWDLWLVGDWKTGFQQSWSKDLLVVLQVLSRKVWTQDYLRLNVFPLSNLLFILNT